MKFAVTIARTYGSGGKEIGRKLAKRLGTSYYGRDGIITTENEALLSDDESIRFSSSIAGSEINHSKARELFAEQSADMERLADRESCVFVGRCSDYVLRDRPNVIKIFIFASERSCMRRVMRLYELNPDEAKEIIRAMNKSRSEYYHFHTGLDRNNALHYDLCINVSDMDTDTVADFLADIVRHRLEL